MSKTKVTVDLFPSPKTFGVFGLVLFFIGFILLICIFINYDLMALILSGVLWIVGVYIGRNIEAQYYKHKAELDKQVQEIVDEKEKTG